ncbi:MAG: amidohydrolase family protein [Clostridia bacterium]|nr:amidohydrolase family protein [Clostridia bacterium]
MGAEHVIWSVDYPYIKLDNATDFLINSDLTSEEKKLISHKNAEKLLKI